jgi:hypothetical protein
LPTGSTAAANSEWAHFYGTAYDNPSLDPTEVDALVAEYPKGSIQLREEVYAELLSGGAGKAFPEWQPALHVRRFEPPRDGSWFWFAGMDWGYRTNGGFWLMAEGPEGDVAVRWEFYFSEKTPFDVGKTVGESLKRFLLPEWIAADSAMWAVTDGGPTVAEEVERGIQSVLKRTSPPLVQAPKGPESRTTRKMLMHELLKWSEINGEVRPWTRPKFSVHPECVNLIRTLPRLLLDEKQPEKVAKDQEDHPFDGTTYAMMVRRPLQRPKWEDVGANRHPGFDMQHRRRRDPQSEWMQQIEQRMGNEQTPGYGMPGDTEYEEVE